MSNFLQRAITGVIFVIVLVGCIIWNSYSLAGLFFVVALLGANEFYTLAEKGGAKPQRVMGLLAAALLYVVLVLPKFGWLENDSLVLLLPLIAALFIAELYRKQAAPFTNLAYTLFGLYYAVLPFALFNAFSADVGGEYVFDLALGYFFLIWTNDTGAYLSGRALGKHKLFERISPKKTWEGTIGGVLLSLGVAWVLSIYFDALPLIHWLAIALIVVVVGSLGDLVESMFKRSIDIKDSGNILPGHGGILDRFDGVLLSAPVVFAYLKVFVD